MRRLAATGPYLVLAAVTALVVARWDAWPSVYPVHWGPRGPDRHAVLSAARVARQLLLALGFLAWLEALRAHVLRNAAPGPDGRSPAIAAAAFRGVQWALAALLGATIIPSSTPAPVLVGLAVALLALAVSLAVAFSRGPRSHAAAPPPDGWLYVPRRIGAGVTVARGHPRAARAWALALGPPLLLAVAAIVL